MVSHRLRGIKLHGHIRMLRISLPHCLSRHLKKSLRRNDMNSIQSRTAKGNKGRFPLSEKGYYGKGSRTDLETHHKLKARFRF
jgi:hypothetical protein